MFRRFSTCAREVVVEARDQQLRLGHHVIGTEHLVLALLTVGQPAARPLRASGLDETSYVAELEQHLERGRRPDDVDLLHHLGIDAEQVRRTIDKSFGPRSLERARLERERRRVPHSRRWRRRSRQSTMWSPRAKTALELSLREALRLKSGEIRPEHLGLGVLREGDGLGCFILAELDVSFDELRRAWEDMGRAQRRVGS